MTPCPHCTLPLPDGAPCPACEAGRGVATIALLGLLATGCAGGTGGGGDTAAVALYGVEMVDDDNDGFAPESVGGDDCDDNDPDVYPCAPDTDGDNVDSDCDGSDAPDPTCD